jgi:hypothetical protein
MQVNGELHSPAALPWGNNPAGCELDRGVGVRAPVRAGIFYSPYRPHRFWGPPASYLMSSGALSPKMTWPGREADHSFLTSTDFKKTWICNPFHKTRSCRSR